MKKLVVYLIIGKAEFVKLARENERTLQMYSHCCTENNKLVKLRDDERAQCTNVEINSFGKNFWQRFNYLCIPFLNAFPLYIHFFSQLEKLFRRPRSTHTPPSRLWILFTIQPPEGTFYYVN